MSASNADTQEIERNLSGEQASDLAALENMAGQGEAQMQALEPVPGEAVPSLAGELQGAITMAVQMLGPVFPSLVEIYKPPVVESVSGAVAAVCTKHGWLQDGLMGRYGEEIACVAVVGPVAFATYKGIQADIAARAPKQPEAVPGEISLAAAVPVPDQMPGAKTVSVGVPA